MVWKKTNRVVFVAYRLSLTVPQSASLLTILFLTLASSSWAGLPKIVCREPVYDFGSLANTNSVVHVFEIRNDGDAPLQIGDLRACCGARMAMAAKTLAPGSTATAEASFSLAGRGGHQGKSFYIASNDPTQPYLQLRLEGTALTSESDRAGTSAATAPQPAGRALKVVPAEIILLERAGDPKPITRYILIHSLNGQPFKVLKTQAPESGIDVTVHTLPSGDIRLALAGILPSKVLDGKTFVITTDREPLAEITVPIRVLTPTQHD